MRFAPTEERNQPQRISAAKPQAKARMTKQELGYLAQRRKGAKVKK
jgi:hypothetical protein